MDVDYSPTGREFVAGSYDRSVRIFAYNGGRSREVYHTKRMQRCVKREATAACRIRGSRDAPARSVFAVRFSGDGVYVFSGSEDMNVRIWKAEASAQIGPVRALSRLDGACIAYSQHRLRSCFRARRRRRRTTPRWWLAMRTCLRSSELHGAFLTSRQPLRYAQI